MKLRPSDPLAAFAIACIAVASATFILALFAFALHTAHTWR
jgi:hypothetical protein